MARAGYSLRSPGDNFTHPRPGEDPTRALIASESTTLDVKANQTKTRNVGLRAAVVALSPPQLGT